MLSQQPVQPFPAVACRSGTHPSSHGPADLGWTGQQRNAIWTRQKREWELSRHVDSAAVAQDLKASGKESR